MAMANSVTTIREMSEYFVEPPDGRLVDTLVSRGLTAQREIVTWSETRIDALLRGLANAVADRAEPLAAAAVAETGMGNVRDKTVKNSIASVGIYTELAGQIGYGEVCRDDERQVAEIASPVGLVVGLLPAAHPVATFIFKTLIALKGRNAIILCPSARALRVSDQVGGLIREGLRLAGAPIDLVQWLGRGTDRETVAALIGHRQVGLVVATGSHALVQAAYRSGRPAIGVGPGNAPVLIAEDADIAHAVQAIVHSKSFDNGLTCGTESHLVVEDRIKTRVANALTAEGAAILTSVEAARFRTVAVNPMSRQFVPRLIGRDAAALADQAHIKRPYPIQLLVIPTESLDQNDFLAAETLAPIVTLRVVANVEDGIEMCRALLDIDGSGHTAMIHTHDAGLGRRFAAAMPATRILINSSGTQGLLGVTTGLVPSMTLAYGTWVRSSMINRVCSSGLVNIKRVASYTAA